MMSLLAHPLALAGVAILAGCSGAITAYVLILRELKNGVSDAVPHEGKKWHTLSNQDQPPRTHGR